MPIDRQRSTRLVPMTADTRQPIGAALRCVGRPHGGAGAGAATAKVGVLLDDLCRPEDAPPALFAAPSPKNDALLAAVDLIKAVVRK